MVIGGRFSLHSNKGIWVGYQCFIIIILNSCAINDRLTGITAVIVQHEIPLHKELI